MDSARPGNPQSFLSLQEAAQRLAVSVDVLLKWNEHNILKPTITNTGQVGYREEQINQFLTIRQLSQAASSQPMIPTPSPVATPAPAATNPTTPPPASLWGSDVPAGGSLSSTDSPEYINISPFATASTQQSPRKRIFTRSYRSYASIGVVVLLLGIFMVTQKNVTPYSESALTAVGSEDQEAQASTLEFSEKSTFTPAIQLHNEKASTAKYLQVEGDNVLHEKLATPYALYGSKVTKMTTDHSRSAREQLARGATPPGGVALSQAEVMSVFGSSEEAASAIDEDGNIKGKADKLDPTTLLGGMRMDANDSLSHVNTDPKMQLIFLTIGTLAFFSLFWKQLIIAAPKAHHHQLHTAQQVHTPVYTPLQTFSQTMFEVAQKTDGTVVVRSQGKEYKVSKPELYSESDQFIERLLQLSEPHLKELEYDSLKEEKIRITAPLSRLVTRLGFVGTKRDLFFPRTSKDKLLFRRYVTLSDINAMDLTPEQILRDLTKTF